MRSLLILPLLAACAYARPLLRADSEPQYELTRVEIVVDASVLNSDDVIATPSIEEVAPFEAAAFQAEAIRLASHSDINCRRLADAMQAHLDDVRMYGKAIVRYVGPYKFYGVGHSYQRDGQWMIRIARRLDDLNARTLAEKLRTLRHETSHTLGASEHRVGDEWSAYDYAERCG